MQLKCGRVIYDRGVKIVCGGIFREEAHIAIKDKEKVLLVCSYCGQAKYYDRKRRQR